MEIFCLLDEVEMNGSYSTPPRRSSPRSRCQRFQILSHNQRHRIRRRRAAGGAQIALCGCGMSELAKTGHMADVSKPVRLTPNAEVGPAAQYPAG
jgi:hypothetical protein